MAEKILQWQKNSYVVTRSYSYFYFLAGILAKESSDFCNPLSVKIAGNEDRSVAHFQ